MLGGKTGAQEAGGSGYEAGGKDRGTRGWGSASRE